MLQDQLKTGTNNKRDEGGFKISQKTKIRKLEQCRSCGKQLSLVLSLGETPLANSFVKPGESEESFPLELCLCQSCSLVQLGHVVDPELMFRNYLYTTGVSETFRRHFASMAKALVSELNLSQDSLVVDIGSNDGLLLGSFKKLGCKVVGIEPASNLASIADKNGITTINDFFSDKTAAIITVKYGKADLITATNVFAHVDNLETFLSVVKTLLKNDGRLVIEVPYLAKMIEMMTFDTIYHEHLSYFSALSMVNVFTKNRMQVISIDEVDIHGGSLRVSVKNRDAEPPPAVQKMVKQETDRNLNKLETYTRFARRVTKSKSDLLRFLSSIRARNQTIVGYGAAAKANTLLNYCGISRNYVEYIVDDNPLKQGLLTPGTHIPVLPSKTLSEERPNYILVLAWNLADEIAKKVRQNYGNFEFIVPLPHPRLVQ